jgi:hypothetical protein
VLRQVLVLAAAVALVPLVAAAAPGHHLLAAGVLWAAAELAALLWAVGGV